MLTQSHNVYRIPLCRIWHTIRKSTELIKNMPAFSRKKFKIRRVVLVAIVSVYVIATCATELFHKEDCHHDAVNAGRTGVLSCNEQCPACTFSAVYNSTEANYGLALVVVAESRVIFQSLQPFTIVNHHEWAHSIVLRAPPSILTS